MLEFDIYGSNPVKNSTSGTTLEKYWGCTFLINFKTLKLEFQHEQNLIYE